ncbi:MAG: electron transport complex subunit RsxC [Deltaproteobacteria bacterium]|nr:electron transport complex subunit RsxC [Deltaproteobacteria bacterium]
MSLFRLKEFTGTGSFDHGIHPPENKGLSADIKVEVIGTPEMVALPLSQHVGAPCRQIVEPKQEVKYGEMIGIGDAFISAPIHSPVSGTVKNNINVTLPTGRHLPAVSIKSNEEGPMDPGILWQELTSDDWSKDISGYDPESIPDIIKNAGIVGLGGAAFPTHVKYIKNEKKPVNVILINGCECEPYLTCDYRMMIEAPHAIVTGALLGAHSLSAKEIIIGVEDNKPEAINILKEATKNTPVKIAVLKTKYPQGGEKSLIKSVLGLEVPLGGLPGDIGVAVSNVGTIAAVAMAVIKGRPLTHRVVSVSGQGINNPKNLFVPIGISMGELIEYCGGLTPDAGRLIAGGPMMGFSFSDLSAPITKGSSGITVITNRELIEEKETSCIRCGRCVDACPMNLVPTRLALGSRYKNPEVLMKYFINACYECGCCAHVCPAKINLVQLIRSGKRFMATQQTAKKGN